MHAATEQPPGLPGFSTVPSAPVGREMWFRAPAGRFPDVPQIAMRGRRRPRIEACWDGYAIAL